jgi:hypothetical protein
MYSILPDLLKKIERLKSELIYLNKTILRLNKKFFCINNVNIFK